MQAATGTYVFDQRRHDEHERLVAMEDLWDAGTKAVIESLGIEPGWRCLEVGAGGGSIATWLAAKVEPAGEVLATDISTRHLEAVDRPNVEVRRHDILSDPLPGEVFDLVHARLVVEHLGRRALERMASVVRPGGWLVLEDFDWGAMSTHPHDEHMVGVLDALAGFMSRSGYESRFGRTLVHEIEAAGLQDVDADGRLRVYRGGSPGTTMLRLSIESLSAALVASGALAPEDLERALATLDDPGTVFLSAAMIAAWGRKPTERDR